MFTFITDVGKSRLENLQSGQTIQFSKYEIGLFSSDVIVDKHDVPYSQEDVFYQANLNEFITEFEAPADNIIHRLVSDTHTVLKMYVPQDFEYFKFNGVVIHAKIGADEFPYLVSYALETNPKLSTEINRYGMRYFFMLQLNLLNRSIDYNFSNLAVESVDFDSFDWNLYTPPAITSKKDQAIIENHIIAPEGYKVFVVESEGQRWGVLCQPWSYNENFASLEIDGESLTIDNEPIFIDISKNKQNIVLTGKIGDVPIVTTPTLILPDNVILTMNENFIVMLDDKYVVTFDNNVVLPPGIQLVLNDNKVVVFNEKYVGFEG